VVGGLVGDSAGLFALFFTKKDRRWAPSLLDFWDF
jgi:hypothetical protein